MMGMLEEIVFASVAGGAIFFGFGILGIISDVILARYKRLNDWINTLPMMQEEKAGAKLTVDNK